MPKRKRLTTGATFNENATWLGLLQDCNGMADNFAKLQDFRLVFVMGWLVRRTGA